MPVSSKTAAAATVLALAAGVNAQQRGQAPWGTDWTQVYDPSTVPSANHTAEMHTRMLTPDGYWHNRYFALLSMASYGDFNANCPVQTFTEDALRKNFPQSDRVPWTVVNTFGPTASGAKGFTAIVPEMNKALIIFSGNYELEQNIPLEVVPFSYLGLESYCPGCTVNKFAADGYLEARNETNDWADILGQYYNTGLVFAIAGHGLGGMHSQIASMDLNSQGHAWYSHSYGQPRTFNHAGAAKYNEYFNGEAGERGIVAGDWMGESIPAGPDYEHAGTPMLYWGFNQTSGNPNWHICWDDSVDGRPAGAYEDPECLPGAQPDRYNLTATQAHYHYFTNVGDCGGTVRPNMTVLNDFINSGGQVVDAPNLRSMTASSAAAGPTSIASQASQAGQGRQATASITSASSARPYAYPPSYSA